MRGFLNGAGDWQRVCIGSSYIFSFNNSAGDVFSIPSEDVRMFLCYFNDNYGALAAVWEAAPERKESIDLYEEKSFRKMYVSVEGVPGLRSISTLGKSQTKSLTLLLSKLICFLSKKEHVDYSSNTLFRKEYLQSAVDNWDVLVSDEDGDGENVALRTDAEPEQESVRASFKIWMRESGSAESTVRSYAHQAVDKAQEMISRFGKGERPLLLMSSSQIDDAYSWLSGLDEWKKVNLRGKGMYQSGLQKFREFKHLAEAVSVTVCRLPKPFVLLAGISGTGKSRFVREQARRHNLDMANFCLVAVRPDWHEPSDLLGYVTRLSGTAKYVATDVLRFMVSAWRGLIYRGFELSGSGGITKLSGDRRTLETVPPYWLCLDEMNLAPVEQYFAEYLSLIETRDWQYNGFSFSYSCEALLSRSVLVELDTASCQELASALGLMDISPDGSDYALWQHFLAHGISIPPNMIVAGTVNMDETTHGFSRKVIDRALSFDFGEFFPNAFEDFYATEINHVALSFPCNASARQVFAINAAQPSIDFLQAVNSVLKGSPFELAYRALNELLLAVHCHGSSTLGPELQAVWDDFLMQKVLPRIEGDVDKLQGDEDGNLLSRLYDLLEVKLADIWSEGSRRPDFYRLRSGKPMTTNCRSKRKIMWMLDRLVRSGFTSFWP